MRAYEGRVWKIRAKEGGGAEDGDEGRIGQRMVETSIGGQMMAEESRIG